MQIIIKIGIVILNIIYFFIKIFKTKNKITFISRQSNKVNLDFKLIIDKINNQLPNYKTIALTKKMGKNKLAYIMHMFKQMYHIATSRIVILDSYCIPISILKHKKELKVVQMWHALGLMKKAGYSILDKEEGRGKTIAKLMKMHKNYDYIFASSEACKKALAEVFNYPEKCIITMPLPRVDLLRNQEYIESKKRKVIEKHPELATKKNIVYAPTYRKDETMLKAKIDEIISEIDYNRYNLVIKLHPVSKIEINDDRVIIASDFGTAEMLTISNYVIVDYSGIIYEAGILKKPLYFYAFDYESYKTNRGFFINYEEEIPNKNYKSGKDLFNSIKQEEYDMERQDEFINKYVDLSSENCTEDIVNFITKLIDKETK